MPDKPKSEPKRKSKKTDIKWKSDKSQILVVEETVSREDEN